LDRFADCIAKGRLKKTEVDLSRVATELRAALNELDRARARFRGGVWDEVTTQSYFAIYRAARAALLFHGYVDTNFYGLCIGVEHLLIEPGYLPAEAAVQVRDAKNLKDVVYNGGRSSRLESGQMLQRALAFTRIVLEVLALPEFESASRGLTLPETRERPGPARRPRGDDPSTQ